jgi:hypothetical protein
MSWLVGGASTFDDSPWKSHARTPIVLSIFSTYKPKKINNRGDDILKERRKGNIPHTFKYVTP